MFQKYLFCLLVTTHSIGAMLTLEQVNNQFSSDLYTQARLTAEHIREYEQKGCVTFRSGVCVDNFIQNVIEAYDSMERQGISPENLFRFTNWITNILLFGRGVLSMEAKAKWLTVFFGLCGEESWRQGLKDKLLRKSAAENQLAMVSWLLENGANPDENADGVDRTPLYWAERKGHADVVQFLRDWIRSNRSHTTQ